KRAGPRTAGRSRATRAGSRPRRTRGRRAGRVGARRSSGNARAAASRADGDEPAAREQRLAGAELTGERIRLELPLLDLPARAVVENGLLVLLGFDVLAQGGVDDDQLGRHPARLGDETLALLRIEVAVEVAGEDAVQRSLLEGERQRVADDESGGRCLPP